jgi:hypothetical protein
MRMIQTGTGHRNSSHGSAEHWAIRTRPKNKMKSVGLLKRSANFGIITTIFQIWKATRRNFQMGSNLRPSYSSGHVERVRWAYEKTARPEELKSICVLSVVEQIEERAKGPSEKRGTTRKNKQLGN